jgi:hypothetical protein
MSLKKFDLIDGEYVGYVDASAKEVIVGHIDHVKFNPSGGCNSVEVAHFSARLDPGCDLFLKHWHVDLFLRSDLRYDTVTATTTVIGNPEGQAGDDEELLNRLTSLRDSDLPFYHRDLPRAFGAGLIRAGACCDPVGIAVHHSTNEEFINFGDIGDLDSD